MSPTPSSHQRLGQTIAGLVGVPEHPALRHLVDALKARYGGCVAAVLFYGSCLRSEDPYDGLVDLYLVVDDYRCVNGGWLKAVWNRALPPNVFYTEIDHENRTLRCKYAVLSLADLKRGTSARWYHSYFWGRFSQPTAVAFARDAATGAALELSLGRAAVTFLNRVLPRLPAEGSVQSLWEGGLRLSYRAELRAEGASRARLITRSNPAYYETVTRAAAPLLRYSLEIEPSTEDTRYRAAIPAPRRAAGRAGWLVRIGQGKLLSVARLLKALFTFAGGLDYIAWKLERHSGVPVEIPEKVRRYPLIFVWGMFWKLYRRGVFR
ncbi:MAG: hypothetical protein PVI91_05045 [Gammaproteobacteria bacterium]